MRYISIWIWEEFGKLVNCAGKGFGFIGDIFLFQLLHSPC